MKVVMVKTGEVKNVPDGYARNYLLPNKLAVSATESAVSTAEAKQAEFTAQQAKLKAQQVEQLKRLQAGQFELKAKANASGKLFAALKAADVAKTLGVAIEAVHVEPIKQTGMHDVTVHFSGQPKQTVSINVVAE